MAATEACFDQRPLCRDSTVCDGSTTEIRSCRYELGGERSGEFTRQRFTVFGRTGNDRRHLISTILFVERTKDTAHAVMFGLLTNVKDAKTFTAVTNLNYEGWFAKNNGLWKITRWVDAPSSRPGR